MNPRAAGAAAMRRNRPSPYRPLPFRPGGYNRGQGGPIIPPGGKHGGLLGYRNGGRTGTPRAAGFLGGSGDPRKLIERYKERSQGRWPRPFSSSPPGGWQMGGAVGRRAGAPLVPSMPQGWQGASVPVGPNIPIPPRRRGPGGWQAGGEVGAAPEEVAMASEIFARATPEQQAQITGGGGGPGMMDEEAAIGEALAMAMGGGPPMGGPPMNGAPPMGGLI